MCYTVIDFETAHTSRNSACEVGIAVIEEGRIVENRSCLIKPHCYPNFNLFNSLVHKIRPEDVANQALWPEVWESVAPYLLGRTLVAHNAAFDVSVINSSHLLYKLSSWPFEYLCSYQLAKLVWKGLPSYRLSDLVYQFSLPRGGHRAGPDALATAHLLIKMQAEIDCTLQEYLTRRGGRLGLVDQDFHIPFYAPGLTYTAKKAKPGLPEPNLGANSEGLLFGKSVVFTGTMSVMREMAWDLAARAGSIIQAGVTGATDLLVVGQQDIRLVGEDGMSGKQEKAVAMSAKGHHIEVISEADFFQMLP